MQEGYDILTMRLDNQKSLWVAPKRSVLNKIFIDGQSPQCQSWRLGLIGLAYLSRHIVIVISGKPFGGRNLIKDLKVEGPFPDRWIDGQIP